MSLRSVHDQAGDERGGGLNGRQRAVHRPANPREPGPLKELEARSADEGLNRGKLPILVRLYRDGDEIPQKTLQDDLDLSKSTVSKLVDSLVDRGLLRKEQSEEDGRVRLIYLTEAGRELDDPIRKIGVETAQKKLQSFEPAEKEALARYLKRVRENLEQ